MKITTDILIAGTGVAGLIAALNISTDKKVTMLTKSVLEESDSFLAQGGICVLQEESDYDAYYEDTMRAGHYENNPQSVEMMIRSSAALIEELIGYGVDFERKNGKLCYTREGAHSRPRILYHEDITGKEITSKLIAEVKKRKNITILEEFTMTDIVEKENECVGAVGICNDEKVYIDADYTILGTGGIGGLYKHSTNYPHLTGDAAAIAIRHNIEIENLHYIQIHPTTLYSQKKGRSFLISESVRGEGAILLNKNKERFTNELEPRDVVTKAIYEQMEKDNMPYVWMSFEGVGDEVIKKHFPNIYQKCLEEGYDITKECIPIVPAQHYHMGGVHIDLDGRTTMPRLYCAGEAACNGVHGRNRLASNSLLESMVFAKRAAKDICDEYSVAKRASDADFEKCSFTTEGYDKIVLEYIKECERNEQNG